MKKDFSKLAVILSLTFVIACATAQPPPPVRPRPLAAPLMTHETAGCEGGHDTAYLPGVSVDAYPGLPPRAEPKQVVLRFSDGTTIWAKPRYESADCTNYITCRRATLILNPAWKRCSPEGISYEVATEDSKVVFESSF